EMQVALTVHNNVLGCKSSPEAAVVVPLVWIHECEGRPPLIVVEIHQTSRPGAIAIGRQAGGRQCAGWTRRTVWRLLSEGYAPAYAQDRSQKQDGSQRVCRCTKCLFHCGYHCLLFPR